MTDMKKLNNTADLRAFLLERMINLANGKETLAQSQGAAALAKQVNATLSIELQAARLLQGGTVIGSLRISA